MRNDLGGWGNIEDGEGMEWTKRGRRDESRIEWVE